MKPLTQKRVDEFLDQLEQMRKELRAHYFMLEKEQSLYNINPLFFIGKALDGVVEAEIGLRGE